MIRLVTMSGVVGETYAEGITCIVFRHRLSALDLFADSMFARRRSVTPGTAEGQYPLPARTCRFRRRVEALGTAEWRPMGSDVELEASIRRAAGNACCGAKGDAAAARQMRRNSRVGLNQVVETVLFRFLNGWTLSNALGRSNPETTKLGK